MVYSKSLAHLSGQMGPHFSNCSCFGKCAVEEYVAHLLPPASGSGPAETS